MASSSIQGITSSSYSPPQWMHDVFLSFRGKDTRNSFTSHLYSNMVQRGIDVYMDDRELERGKTIEPALWKAIEESRFSVVIFSRDYASSPWCLDELVKIVQCMEEMGHTVLPVFYDVDPSEVAERKGQYEKAFVEHEQNFKENLEKVWSWKDCLTTVANLSGWDVRNRNESESIKKIVEYILYKLSITLPPISKNLVGMDSRLVVLNGYIGEEANGILFVGICGMGGIGKTTVARVVYDRIRWQFEGSCFLANVREVFVDKDGPRRLQEQLLSEIIMERANIWDSSRGIDMIKRRLRFKKILLILDDVDDQKQLEFLAAEHGWFGPGSRIIITSRNKNVLDRNGVTRIYEAEKLNDDDALILFSRKAFKKDQPAEDFVELSKQVVGYANGLPLALEVIGSFLHGRSILQWGSAINRLNEIPDGKIIDVLCISFDGLHVFEKEIFLDIACFLKGFKKDRIIRILDSCGFHADIGIQVLIERSLISVSQDQVWMHNLLQIMGKEIVRCESPAEPGRRSRLWAYKDVCLALMDNTGKEKVETIFLDMPGIKEAQWNMKAFLKMSKLRLLKIHNVQLSEGPEYLSNELRFLEWHAYPSKSLPACFQLDKLVELDMAYSSIEQLWHGFKSSVNLKIINLSHSLNLTKTPDFTGIPNLESLILEGCTSLSEVHPSLGHHKKLQNVNLVNCKSIRILPSNLEMESLKVCTLDGCSKLEKFPDIVGNMNCLMELRLDGTGIAELSSSIHHLIGLGRLSMNNCKNLESIPSSIGCLKSLKKLDLSGCSKLKNIPENLGKVESLEEFDVSGTSIRQPPASIFLLKNLKVLSFDGCKRIAVNPMDRVLPSLSVLCSLEVLDLCACNLREGALPEDIGCLSSLRSLDLSRNNFVSLPKSINQLSGLEMLVLEDCRMLESLPEVPSKVQTVNLNGCIRLKKIPDPIKLSSSKRSEFICLNCWELYKHNGQDSMGLTMLERYLQGLSNPRPGFGIAVPGNEIPGWFNHQSKGSSITVQVPSWCMGFVACVAFSAYGESPSLFCHFKASGRENYPSPMCISCNSIQVLSNHLWLFYLSFDYLKELKEWQHESFSNIELSFQSYERRLKVKSCGVCLLYSLYTPSSHSSAHFIVASKEASLSYKASLSVSSSYHHWMQDVFLSFRGADKSNDFTHLSTALALRVIIPDDKELEKVMAIRSRLLVAIEESGLSIIIFSRDCAYLPWCFDELFKIIGFMDEMRPDTVFPVSYDVKQSKIDDQTESYTIVFDKDKENFKENEEKVQRWMNILTEVAISSGSESLERDGKKNVQVSGEATRSVNLPTKSAIYVWGYNQSGQTGRKGKEDQLRIPKQLPPELFGCPAGTNARWLDIACGREYTAAVASDGSLFTWGANEFGQLGDGTEEGRKYPKKVKQLETEFVKSVSCGAHCTAAIAEPHENDGTISSRLWVWGQNQGSNYPRLFRGAFSPNTIICQVSCGAVHVVALSEDGLLQTWGYNEYGQLGRGSTCEGLQGARVINAYARFLDEAPELVKITQVSCREYHTAAISEKGEVYTWGLGNMGQLGHTSLQSGDKELLPRRVVALDGIVIKDVACGGVHTCAVTQKGGLYAWGGGQAGQLGLGPQTGSFSFIPSESESFLRNIPALVVSTDVQLVACGHSHTLVSMRDGRIHGWGYNSYGQAANEKSTYAWYPSPVDWCVGKVRKLAAGGGHSAVLTDACSLKELCEFRLAENVTLSNASEIEDVASRTGADALARLCGRLRENLLGGDLDYEDISYRKDEITN